MDFRMATDNDTTAVKELWAYSFESYEPYFSWYFSDIYKPEQTLCCFDDDILAASLQLAEYRMMLRGQPVPVAYIVGVITAAPYRFQGIASRLLAFAFQELRKRGIALAILLPASPTVYGKNSFAYTYEEHRYDIDLKDLAPLAMPFGNWRMGGLDDIELIDQVYQKMTAAKNGYILRNQQNWRNYLNEHVGDGGRIALLYDDQGQIAGYLLYTCKDDLFSINELGYASKEAQSSAFQFALGHVNEAKRFYWAAPIDDCAYLSLASQEGIAARPFIMARIIDAVAALEAASYPTHARGSMIVQILDKQIEENNLTLMIKVADQKLTAEVIEEPTPAHITMDISALASLLWGRLSVKQLSEQTDKLSGFDLPLEFLSTLFPPCASWMNEHS
jgi:predicted acetyltransferase